MLVFAVIHRASMQIDPECGSFAYFTVDLRNPVVFVDDALHHRQSEADAFSLGLVNEGAGGMGP
jgi:hypothetical protein